MLKKSIRFPIGGSAIHNSIFDPTSVATKTLLLQKAAGFLPALQNHPYWVGLAHFKSAHINL
jgi:hypothetical protein